MGPLGATKSCYSKIVTFSGRAARSEYWWFAVVQVLLGAALTGGFMAYLRVDPTLVPLRKGGMLPYEAIAPQFAIFFGIQILMIWLPGLSVTVRRLHDTDHSGAWYFISVVPLIGAIWLLVLLCLPSDNARNSHGPDPLRGRRRLDTHPALMGEVDPEIKAALREQHKAEFREYYQARVRPSIEQNKARA